MGLDARTADRRPVLARQRSGVVVATRLGKVLTAPGVSTVAAIGVVVGPVFGRVAGAYMALLIPFLDLGIGQSPMLQGQPAAWPTTSPGSPRQAEVAHEKVAPQGGHPPASLTQSQAVGTACGQRAVV